MGIQICNCSLGQTLLKRKGFVSSNFQKMSLTHSLIRCFVMMDGMSSGHPNHSSQIQPTNKLKFSLPLDISDLSILNIVCFMESDSWRLFMKC
jgi:hypothetical protein